MDADFGAAQPGERLRVGDVERERLREVLGLGLVGVCRYPGGAVGGLGLQEVVLLAGRRLPGGMPGDVGDPLLAGQGPETGDGPLVGPDLGLQPFPGGLLVRSIQHSPRLSPGRQGIASGGRDPTCAGRAAAGGGLVDGVADLMGDRPVQCAGCARAGGRQGRQDTDLRVERNVVEAMEWPSTLYVAPVRGFPGRRRGHG